MAWHWVCGDERSEDFTSQEEAENWLKGSWEALLAGGCTSVTLMDGETVAYSMSLEP